MDIEPGDILGCTFVDLIFIIGLGGIFKGIGDIFNTNGEAVSSCNANKYSDGKVRKYWGGILTKIDTFDLWDLIGKTSGAILLEVLYD